MSNQYGWLGLKGKNPWNGKENQITICLNELARERLNYILESKHLGHLSRLISDDKPVSIHEYFASLIHEQWFKHRKYEKDAQRRLRLKAKQKQWSEMRVEKLAEFKKQKKQTTSVYLISDPSTGHTKIGISKDVENRFRALKAANPSISLIFYHVAEFKAEQELHKIFKEQNIFGEWFKLNESQIETAKWILLNLCDPISGKFNRDGLYEWILKNNPFKNNTIGDMSDRLVVIQ